MEITNDVQMTRVSDAVAVGTADAPGSSVDSKGFGTTAFAVFFGAITDGAPNVRVQGSDDDGSADAWADLAGTDVEAADTDNGQVLVVEVKRTSKTQRYLRPNVVRGGATGSVIDAMFALQGDAELVPVTHGAGVNTPELHLTPAEGTA